MDTIRKVGAACLEEVGARIGMAYCGTHSRILLLSRRRRAAPRVAIAPLARA